ncbi:MAG: RpiB/LacA/LacB family sugar-phosphate isomerase [Anaerolineaceae bacterium]|nr:RpiB/LacA/LacB family sugar-phosphate isomerase [Anaerolineaceae bacterium]
MNVLCLGARVIGPETARELVKAFASATFSTEDRHRRRVGKIVKLEENGKKE